MPATPASTATANTLRYLRDIAAKRAIFGPGVDRAATIAEVEARIAAGITQSAASDLISTGNAARRHPDDQMPADDWQVRWLRQTAQTHALYGLGVPVEETVARLEADLAAGFFSRADAYRLRQQAAVAPRHPTAQSAIPLAAIEGIADLDLSEGYYAVFYDDVLRFYRIYTPTSGDLRGQAVIRRFAGDNLNALSPSEITTVLHDIAADPDAAAYRYSDNFGRCFICGRSLTDAVSRLLSVGPTCRGFANHTGLRRAAHEVDHDPTRRAVYRSLRQWALQQGFRDPATKDERQSITMTASRVASAWSGIPGVLALDSDTVVDMVAEALTGQIPTPIKEGLLAAPVDTLLILVESGVLSLDVMNLLSEHPAEPVRRAAGEFFLARLGM